MADGFRIDAHSLEELGRDVKLAASAVRRETEKTAWRVGETVAAAAKEIASQHSQSIPGTIRMRPIPGAAVVMAGNSSVPIAALYELGNRGGKRNDPTFRHPVFGSRDVWVDQPRYRFLQSALSADRAAVTREMEKTWDRALSPYRLRPER